jgi:hypothetical protein
LPGGATDSDLMGGVTKNLVISPIGKEDVVFIVIELHLLAQLLKLPGITWVVHLGANVQCVGVNLGPRKCHVREEPLSSQQVDVGL